jgi:hypothetical protein
MKLALLEYTALKELERQREILAFLDHMRTTAPVVNTRKKREGMELSDIQLLMPEIKAKDLTFLTFQGYINRYGNQFTITPKGRQYLGYLDSLDKMGKLRDADVVDKKTYA